MSTQVMIAPGFAAPSTKLANVGASADDLSAGIGSAYAVVSFRGKVWRIKHRGQETPLMREDGTGPRGTIEVVMVKASPAITKVYYAKGFTEGETAPPDCSSTNGVSPDPAAPHKQSPTCAACPMNQWGSRVGDNGKAGKACSDSKRIAIVPAADMKNEVLGGPMLLRIPPASLATLSQYNAALQQMGHRYYGVVTQIGFDVGEAHPQLTFRALRPLTDAEVDVLLELQQSDLTHRILSEAVDAVRAEIGAPGAPGVAQPVAAPVVAAQPVVAQPVVTPVVQQAAPPIAANPFVTPAGNPPVDDLAIPPYLRSPAAQQQAAAPVVAQPVVAQPVVAQPVVAQPVVAQPVVAQPEPVDPTKQQPGESLEAYVARLQQMASNVAAASKPGRRAKTSPPSPKPTAVEAQPVAQAPAATIAAPVTQPTVAGGAAAPVAPGFDAAALADLDAQLDKLV